MDSLYRIGLAGYTAGIYRLPSDSPENAKQIKEAPIKNKKDLLADEEKKRLLQNQSTQIEIPPEVCMSSIAHLMFQSSFINSKSLISITGKFDSCKWNS